MKLYHINLKGNVTLEVAAENQQEALRKALYPIDVVGIEEMPITKSIQLNETELDFTYILGEISYIIHHMVDADEDYYELSLGQAEEWRGDDIDHDDIVDIRIKMSSPMDFAYGSLDEAKKAIQKAISDANDIYNNAMGY